MVLFGENVRQQKDSLLFDRSSPFLQRRQQQRLINTQKSANAPFANAHNNTASNLNSARTSGNSNPSQHYEVNLLKNNAMNGNYYYLSHKSQYWNDKKNQWMGQLTSCLSSSQLYINRKRSTNQVAQELQQQLQQKQAASQYQQVHSVSQFPLHPSQVSASVQSTTLRASHNLEVRPHSTQRFNSKSERLSRSKTDKNFIIKPGARKNFDLSQDLGVFSAQIYQKTTPIHAKSKKLQNYLEDQKIVY